MTTSENAELKDHPAARMDYSCLDVELDLTIQFEMLDDGRESKDPCLRGKHERVP